jgi:N-acetylmuramoyl-L-alanine amidase
VRSLALAAAFILLPGAARARPPAAVASRAAAVQARKLEAGKASLEKLRSDPRRRRYRDGWEAVLRELDGAVKAAPNGPRAAEAALTAVRARADLWDVTRSPIDARAAIAALRKVDDDHPGPSGAQALAAALGLATRAHDAQEGAAAARRLAERYPQDAKAIGTPVGLAPAPAAAKPQKPAVAEPQKPVVVGDDDEEDDAPEPPTAAATREPDVDVGQEAAKVVEEMVNDAMGHATAPQTKPATPPKTAAAAGKDDELPEPEAPEAPPSRTPPIVRAVKDAVAALTETEDDPATAAKARELRATALASHSSLATQLGLKVRRVVVDAGHGGKDTGAVGPHGVREKDLTLSIARKVAGRLKALGFTVTMTRRGDSFVSLDERTRIANEAHADLFVSIHCNAARKRKLEGVETWTLNVSSDRYAARLAAFENAEADRTVSDLRMILADLATKANATDARDLAQAVQASLMRTLRGRVGPVRDHGVKQALFYVLLGTHMPSILVETGFISNPAEEARLRSARFQEGAAEAIARGVKDFVDARRRLASVP